ncbi:hypothetical protein NQ314_003473 [Rhamnusium bicolor]|uniref:Uncharacterized protein n=1 Tax=Rhamnusium bicolor TaxID=1586634 RepID=A0AAV8ZPK9_9CUCU|nr:hypothetical protein NQ314_003473 [Rhamnusium bicolor]
MLYLKFVVITPPPVPHVLRLETTETRTGLYDEELTCKRYTVGMLTISAIQIIFYYINMMFKDGGQGIIEGVLKFTPSKKYEVWRYVTHIFVHAR